MSLQECDEKRDDARSVVVFVCPRIAIHVGIRSTVWPERDVPNADAGLIWLARARSVFVHCPILLFVGHGASRAFF